MRDPHDFMNVLFGAWIVVSAWMLSGPSAAAQWNGLVAGLLILALSLPRVTFASNMDRGNRGSYDLRRNPSSSWTIAGFEE